MSRQKAQVRLLDHAGEHLGWITEEHARRIEQEGKAQLFGTKNRVRAARMLTKVTELVGGSGLERRHGSAGDAHRHETWSNPRGCWTIDRLPRSMRREFTTVLDQCMKKAA